MTSLPGVPGGSHLYHIGSSGFFLDQPRIALTSQQQAALNKIKERALLERGNAERGIEQAEQELWVLTGAERPDAGKVEAKAREIERLRTDQRLAFIQAVGEATKLLTPEQRSRLLGTASTPAK
jgi:Spy/CpxP family protein refolding chaperone